MGSRPEPFTRGARPRPYGRVTVSASVPTAKVPSPIWLLLLLPAATRVPPLRRARE